MMSSRKMICGAVLGLLVCSSAWSGVPEKNSSRRLAIDEELWLQLADEPGRHFQIARERFVNNDRPTAAFHMRKAAVYLRISAQNSTPNGQRNLTYSANELESLAKGMMSGTVRSIETLEFAFARAEHSLAQHHYAMASESWTQERSRIAGYRLRAAGNATERAARWTGEEIQDGARTVYSGTRTLSGKLIEGTGIVVDEVGKGIGSIGKQIEKVGDRIVPRE